MSGVLSSPRRAFTMIEMLVAMTIVSVLMFGMVSAILIVSRSMQTDSSSARNFEATRVAERILADVDMALSFVERTAHAIEFTVPDRNGDGAPETIRYAWTGTAGDPVTRTLNGSEPVKVADDVHRFDLSFLTRTWGPLPPRESEETLLFAHDNAPGGSFKRMEIKDKKWVGQYFEPLLPVNAVRWQVTRVLVRLDRDGAAPSAEFDLVVADAAELPSTVTVASVSVDRNDLPREMAWFEIQFPTATPVGPWTRLCLVGHSPNKEKIADIHVEESSPQLPENAHFTKGDDGETWDNPDDDRDMRIYVYGTFVTQGEPEWP